MRSITGLAGVLSLDASRLSAWRETCPSGPWQRWADAWLALFRGEAASAVELASAIEPAASELRDPALVVEAAALRAMALSEAGELAAAVSHARRASRMGRTEGDPEHEYLPNLVLARQRRLCGQPHLATRILHALARVVPWREWVEWEQELAAPFSVATPSGTLPTALRALLTASRAGARAEFDTARAQLVAACSAPWVRDVQATAAVLDPFCVPAPEEAAWCAGTSPRTPPRVHGLLTVRGGAPDGESAVAYLWVRPEGPARRVASLGYRFVADPLTLRLRQSKRKQGRTELIACELASAEAPVNKADLFRPVYGFEYDPPRHENTFGVAIHRARDWLGESGSLTVHNASVELTVNRSLLIPDPRCVKPVEDRLLVAVAQHPGSTAKELAKIMGISLPIAQRALRELQRSGSCDARAEGRRMHYTLEDTTFREPTAITR
ncbi:MAG: hypothetical protein AB8I08_04195 [Sandaracinaceae bacterium]